MVASVNNSSITGLPPVYASDDDREQLYQFRAIERTGYLTVTELVRDFLYDGAAEGALTIVNVAVTETHLANADAFSSNPENFVQYGNVEHDAGGSMNPHFLSQRIRTLVNGGAGYQVGDELIHYASGATKANVQVRVDSLDTSSGFNSIKTFSIINSGDYNRTLDPLSANKKLVFRDRPNPKSPLIPNIDFSANTYVDSGGDPREFFFQANHVGTGTGGPTKVPAATIAVQNLSTTDDNWWHLSFGDGTINPKGRGGASKLDAVEVYPLTTALSATQNNKTRWPVDGLWANIKVTDNTKIVPGCEIMLAPGRANVASNIPPGTLVSTISEIEVVDNIVDGAASGGLTPWYERTDYYIWITTSQSVDVKKGDCFIIKGNGAVFSDISTTDNTAEIFTAIVEATDRIDPLADTNVPVFANVISFSGNSVRVGNVSHARSWAPTIFEGAIVEHMGGQDTNGAVVANVANITWSKTTGATVANIVLDINLNPAINSAPNKQLKFTLATRQPWRLAFMANGEQTLNVAAGTSIQMTDDAQRPIARIADYTGSITDITGLIGDVPSLPILSTVDQVTGINFSIGGPVTTVTIGGTSYPKTGPGILTVTSIGGTDLIYSGYAFDYNSMSTTTDTYYLYRSRNLVLMSQILPLDTGESLNGKGRYYVNQEYPGALALLATSTTWGKVIDRKVDLNDITQGFINRSIRVSQYPEAYPMSYFVNFAKHGMFFGVWEGSWTVMQKSRARQISEKDAWFNWFVIQRPVHRKTGLVRTSGQSPVFCINSVGYKYWKFVVRERDVWHPSQGDAETKSLRYNDLTDTVTEVKTPYRVPADAHTEDSHGILNTTHQIALTEDSKYLVSFLYNLTTARFRYSDELDLVGQTAADVSMASSDVKLYAYGESKQRVYKSLGANLPYNAGLRISVLKDIYTA